MFARGASSEQPLRVIAIGNFDGVHRGHQAVLADVARDAAARRHEAAVLTFSPHPLAVLGRPVPPVLTSLPRKIELIRSVSPTIVPIVEPFDLVFAARSPEEFVTTTLVRLGARVVTVGQNFRFGKGRAGDFKELTKLGERYGFETRSHNLVGDAAGPWSSTRVRDAIMRGDLDDAAQILGRPHMISGLVVPGDRIGRTLGFPTSNLSTIEEALPPFGVYAVLVDQCGANDELGDRPAAFLGQGVANIGIRPTVAADARPTVEVHLLDFAGDLYGTRLRVHMVARLRPEKRFGSLEELRAQIARDVVSARERLAGLPG